MKDKFMEDDKKLHLILRHIQGVQANCNELALRLSESGETDFARQLIANGLIHDNSKFYGIEWKYLGDESEENKEFLKQAIDHHRKTNKHHPEAWYSIQEMPRIYLAEMVCDLKQRSAEFGTDLREWIKDEAQKKWKFTYRDSSGKEIKEFVDILLDRKFK